MSGEIDAVYIYDEHNDPLVEHVYRARPPSAAAILPLYLAHAAPRPSLLYIPNASPPVTVFSIVQSNLLFLAVSEVDTEPLLALEFLHRVVDVLEEFVGAPLLAANIQANYDVVAQLLHEMCDGGLVSNTELNALQEVVEVPGWMGKLLGGISMPGASTPTSGTVNPLKQSLAAASAAQGPAIPWRRPGVRHTSNELYVDIIESLSVTMAPSGRLLSAMASGTIAFTAKISGVPDLLLSLSAPGGQQSLARKIELPVFHPSVRLARWRERPGELSFVPPDGRFILAGYEVDLLPIDPDLDEPPSHMEKLFLPAIVDIRKSLGPSGSDFEVRLTLNTNFPGHSSSKSSATRNGSGTSTPSFLGVGSSNTTGPVLEEVVVSVPISKSVRHITDMQASRGDAQYSHSTGLLEWRVPTNREAGTISGTATLRCSVAGYPSVDEDHEDSLEDDQDANANLLQGYYEAPNAYDDPSASTTRKRRDPSKKKKKKKKEKGTKKSSRSAALLEETGEDEGEGESPAEGLSDAPAKAKTPSPSHSKPHTPTPPPQPQPPSQLPAFFAPSSAPRPGPRRTKAQINTSLMPTSAAVSFSVRGWLPSGIKVDSLNIDQRRSRGLGDSVKPYKGVKYLCVSRRGVERRC